MDSSRATDEVGTGSYYGFLQYIISRLGISVVKVREFVLFSSVRSPRAGKSARRNKQIFMDFHYENPKYDHKEKGESQRS